MKVNRSETMKCFKRQKKDFKLNTEVNREPVKISQNRCYMIMFGRKNNETSSSILDELKSIDYVVGETMEDRITVIKSRGDKSMNKSFSG